MAALRTYDPYAPSNAPVKRPQRKRGYDDKGHLPDKTKAKEEPDFTRKRAPRVLPEQHYVQNQLWFSELGKETQQGTILRNNTSKGGSGHERKTNNITNSSNSRQDRSFKQTKRLSSCSDWRTAAGRINITNSFVQYLLHSSYNIQTVGAQCLPTFAYYILYATKIKQNWCYGEHPPYVKQPKQKDRLIAYLSSRPLSEVEVSEIEVCF